MMNENPEPIKESTEQEENKIAINYKPKEKNPRRVAAGKKGAEARAKNAELRKKEQEKLKKENLKLREQSERSPLKMTSEQSEKNDLPQITKDSDKETDYEKNVRKNYSSKIDYKFVLVPLGIIGLGLFFYNQSNKPEKMIREVMMGDETTKTEPKLEKKKKPEIDPFEFN